MAIGFRILPVEQRIDAELVSRFAALPVANVSDAMSRMTAGGASLRPMHAGGVLAGPAVTVKARPGDNLMLHKALDIAEPGDVVVVDAGGDLTNALIGELMTAYAESRGIAGIVIWGAIRDAATIRANAFPVFAAGVTHRGPYKDGPGEVNVPIAIEGMVIRPGDLLLGDDDGLVCVPIADAEQVLKTASAKHAAETAQMEKIRRGENPRAWVDETLKRLGCERV
ncbi:RraA family protein [Sphingomonas sanguinis]|uniref:Putative 4-hydroxy-4-methyl-2-oxoglutarate aldolase n=1 Tax=Sphingomonas sanguinis TaxID=33051 RepID=A0ABU5LTJ2_9SPHN|nr:RraA family protein [Sphingomonas sanguinis]MDZ7283253.1 RraA family protein [Sphingomonas sanguinis]QXT35900.1 RraA family protein [Sphingomonas sanguinis]